MKLITFLYNSQLLGSCLWCTAGTSRSVPPHAVPSHLLLPTLFFIKTSSHNFSPSIPLSPFTLTQFSVRPKSVREGSVLAPREGFQFLKYGCCVMKSTSFLTSVMWSVDLRGIAYNQLLARSQFSDSEQRNMRVTTS